MSDSQPQPLNLSDSPTNNTSQLLLAPEHATAVTVASQIGHATSVDVSRDSNVSLSLNQLTKQPDQELFHAMLSYRVSTDAHLASAIHDRLHFKALNAKKKLDFYAAAKYPSGFNRNRDTKLSWINIFLDKVCLRTGKDWADEGFILALLQSISVIPILSWNESSNGEPPTGSVGQLAHHGTSSNVDNVLLELVLAKELHSTWQMMSKTSIGNDMVLFPCMQIVPIYVHDLFSKLSKLSDEPPAATLKKAAEVLRSAGHVTGASFMHQSVKSIVCYFTRLQGIKYYELGNADSANEQVTNRLWDILKTMAQDYDINRFQMNSFAQNNPHGSELLDFLTESNCGYLSRSLIKHNVSSVALLAGLKQSESSILALAQDTSKICKRPLIEETLKINSAINQAAASPLSLPLKSRLLNFVDKDASVLTAIYSSSAVDIMMSKPIFRVVMIFMGLVEILFGIRTSLDVGVFAGSALVLFWTGSVKSLGAITAIFFPPRYGRYLFSMLFVGNVIILTSIFVASYFKNNGSILNADDERSFISSRVWAEFGRSYQFFALLVYFFVMFYSVTFRQRFAWSFCLIFLAHKLFFDVLMNLTMLRPPGTMYIYSNGLAGTGCICLLMVTEVSKRLGKAKAQRLVLADLYQRQSQWSDLIKDLDQIQKFEGIESLLLKSDLSPICEKLNRNHNLIAIDVFQEHADIDKLYCDCTVLNFFFQDWVRMWFTSGNLNHEFEYCNPKSPFKDIFKIQISDCFPEVLRGPIKSPNRSIAKVQCV